MAGERCTDCVWKHPDTCRQCPIRRAEADTETLDEYEARMKRSAKELAETLRWED
jgi:hypothetical protein